MCKHMYPKHMHTSQWKPLMCHKKKKKKFSYNASKQLIYKNSYLKICEKS